MDMTAIKTDAQPLWIFKLSERIGAAQKFGQALSFCQPWIPRIGDCFVIGLEAILILSWCPFPLGLKILNSYVHRPSV
jgi:hypothetical protein